MPVPLESMAQSCFDMRIGVALLARPAIAAAAVRDLPPQQTAPQFGGTYATLDARRKHLVDNWVARFNSVTGQKVEAGASTTTLRVFIEDDVPSGHQRAHAVPADRCEWDVRSAMRSRLSSGSTRTRKDSG